MDSLYMASILRRHLGAGDSGAIRPNGIVKPPQRKINARTLNLRGMQLVKSVLRHSAEVGHEPDGFLKPALWTQECKPRSRRFKKNNNNKASGV